MIYRLRKPTRKQQQVGQVARAHGGMMLARRGGSHAVSTAAVGGAPDKRTLRRP